jgi:AraC-like DNA-binding protein
MLLTPDAFTRLCQARDLLNQIHETPPSIKQVAKEIHMSPFHFIRQFEALFGLTPHQFRIQSRLDHAKRLLAMGHHSVTEVCMEVGMSSWAASAISSPAALEQHPPPTNTKPAPETSFQAASA